VRDGIIIAQRQVPSVVLITEPFWAQSAFLASGAGMPDVPRIKLPYPVAGCSDNELRRIAATFAPLALRSLHEGQ
jgi:hypothetical protein